MTMPQRKCPRSLQEEGIALKGVVRNVFLGRMEYKPSTQGRDRVLQIDSAELDGMHQKGTVT